MLGRRLEADLPALRLTPDDWMVPLFGEPEGKRDDLEGLLIRVAMRELAGSDDRPGDPSWPEWSRRRWPTLAG